MDTPRINPIEVNGEKMEKKPYSSPRLTTYGNIEKLTNKPPGAKDSAMS